VFFFVNPDDPLQYADGNINDSETRFAILKQNHDDAARIISAGAWNRLTGKKVEENHRSKGLIHRINRLAKVNYISNNINLTLTLLLLGKGGT